jgi:hypothetical protein
VDVDIAEVDSFSFDTADDEAHHMIREDVFLLSLGYKPAVSIEDADGVYLENVEIGGSQDISERYFNLARPVIRQGGPALGSPDLGEVNSRGATDHILLTPVKKVETLRLTNVRSRAKIRYGRFS